MTWGETCAPCSPGLLCTCVCSQYSQREDFWPLQLRGLTDRPAAVRFPAEPRQPQHRLLVGHPDKARGPHPGICSHILPAWPPDACCVPRAAGGWPTALPAPLRATEPSFLPRASRPGSGVSCCFWAVRRQGLRRTHCQRETGRVAPSTAFSAGSDPPGRPRLSCSFLSSRHTVSSQTGRRLTGSIGSECPQAAGSFLPRDEMLWARRAIIGIVGRDPGRSCAFYVVTKCSLGLDTL